MKITIIKLSLRVDIQMITQWRFNLWWFSNLKLNISCVHFYILSSKTNRYALFGHNRLTVYGIRLATFMLVLRQKFKFQNIQHVAFYIRLAAFEIRIAACEIRIAVYAPEAYCPKSGLSFTIPGKPLATVNFFSKITIWPQNFPQLY